MSHAQAAFDGSALQNEYALHARTPLLPTPLSHHAPIAAIAKTTIPPPPSPPLPYPPQASLPTPRLTPDASAPTDAQSSANPSSTAHSRYTSPAHAAAAKYFPGPPATSPPETAPAAP